MIGFFKDPLSILLISISSVFFLVSYWYGFAHIGDIPAQFMTALGAILAAWMALFALRTQRDLGRKRAAIDIFLKTETDATTLGLWKSFEESVGKYDAVHSDKKDQYLNDHPEEVEKIESYLNILELIACGVEEGILDEKLCRNFFENVFLEYHSKLQRFVTWQQSRPFGMGAYCEFDKRSKEWGSPSE